MTQTLGALYTKEYKSMEELEQYTLQELQQFHRGIEEDVGLLEEETRILNQFIRAQKEKENVSSQINVDDDDARDTAPAAGGGRGGGGGRRTGQGYDRKQQEQKEVYLSLDEKQAIAAAEQERLKTEREKTYREADEQRDLVSATMEEAQSRIKEVKLELAYFKREVANERDVSADKILKYFADRPASKEQYIRKLRDKIVVLNQQIAKSNQQLKQREDVGEAFHTIDFDQLKIENHQFNERIEQKNVELVELKGTTTRTVQTLNGLTDKLNQLMAEQTQLKKELKSRQDYVNKLTSEIETVRKEGSGAQRKNTAMKIQHEAVKVPKVEDYIAQKAELYELEKAALNWKRKVEIAAGHEAVIKQQMIALKKKASLRGATK